MNAPPSARELGLEPASPEDRLRAALAGGGCAVTPQRRVIFLELTGRRDHPTAEELYSGLRRALPRLSLATVYKSLHLFSRLGLVRAVATPDGKAHFDAREPRHHHLRCVECGRITDLFDPRVQVTVPRDLPEATGHSITGLEAQLSGTCAQCRRKRRSGGDGTLALRRRWGPRERPGA